MTTNLHGKTKSTNFRLDIGLDRPFKSTGLLSKSQVWNRSIWSFLVGWWEAGLDSLAAIARVQGYLAHTKQPPPKTLQ